MFPGIEAFATPKPERLMDRIIRIATNRGDVVLDCFAGSGTTAAVAHKLGRRWVTTERESGTVEQFTRPRLEKVVAGTDPGGITPTVGWHGGGGFRTMQVGSSMFDLDVESSEVFLAEWASNGAFSEAVAAQLGFELADESPFCGRKGRTRLAVLDGVIGAAEVEYLVSALGDRERLVVVGKAVTDDADATLRGLSPGSRIRFAPDDLLRRGGRR
jgi:adenine-specific DNA-methyltransferase